MLVWLLFLYGLAAGFLLVRLRRRPDPALTMLGWLVAALSLTLAAALLAWLVWTSVAA